MLVLAACGGGTHHGVGASNDDPAVVSSTTSVRNLKAQVLARWQAAEDAYDGAVTNAQGPDPNDPDLDRTMIGNELEHVRAYLQLARSEGYVGRGHNGHGAPAVTALSSTQATVLSCLSDGTYFVVAATGKPAPGSSGNPGPTPAGIRSTMVLDPLGVWRMSDSVVTEGACSAA
jgi:hypothetical protein